MIHQLSIPSNLRHLNEVELFIQEVIEFYELPAAMHAHFMLTVCESVNNAIAHGNKQDLRKQVRIYIEREENELNISVEDEGHGFDYENIPDPTDKHYIRNERGRGLFLIRNLADDVSFHNNGSLIKIKFDLEREFELLLRRNR